MRTPHKRILYPPAARTDGVILLLVVIVLTAIFSISIGVFSVILGQVTTSGTFENSATALYAADQSIERTFYRDRQERDFSCDPLLSCSTDIPAVTLASGGCMLATISKTPAPVTTQITARGLSSACPPALVTERTVARAFLITY